MDVIMKMEKTESFKSVGAKLSRRMHHLCKDKTWGSKEYWTCYIRDQVFTVYHPTSTCKMGAFDDKTAVVDPRLRYVHVVNF